MHKPKRVPVSTNRTVVHLFIWRERDIYTGANIYKGVQNGAASENEVCTGARRKLREKKISLYALQTHEIIN